MKAYDETQIAQHLFLPIVSLGKNTDKNIPWGATVPDSEGNYYYTSFSPAGYILPWLFIKCLGLDISEKSLYIFNSFLLVLSGVIWIRLLSQVYKESKHKRLLCLVGGITYIFAPEILHGMGIVYWHQSVMQVALLLQILAYYEYTILQNQKYRFAFYGLTLINPYIEWTGYVANVGFALSELIRNRKDGFVKSLSNPIKICVLTIFSFIIFSAHYLLRIEANTFLEALKNRFMARNVTTSISLTDVFGGYYKSFLFIWLLLLCFLIWNFIKNKKLEISNGLLLFVMTCPILENVIMKEHALSYTYDRMKAVFLLIFILCEIIRNLLSDIKSIKVIKALIVILTLVCATLNFYSYKNDESYIWNADYKGDNTLLANYITEKYADALYATNWSVRGYMNLLWGRGIYEWQTLDSSCTLAKSLNMDEIIFINTGDSVCYKIKEVIAYDLNNKDKVVYAVIDNKVIGNEQTPALQLANLTDENWTNGCSNTSNILLFNRDDSILITLLSASKIICGGNRLEVIDIDYDDLWIRVEVSGDITECMYPAILETE